MDVDLDGDEEGEGVDTLRVPVCLDFMGIGNEEDTSLSLLAVSASTSLSLSRIFARIAASNLRGSANNGGEGNEDVAEDDTNAGRLSALSAGLAAGDRLGDGRGKRSSSGSSVGEELALPVLPESFDKPFTRSSARKQRRCGAALSSSSMSGELTRRSVAMDSESDPRGEEDAEPLFRFSSTSSTRTSIGLKLVPSVGECNECEFDANGDPYPCSREALLRNLRAPFVNRKPAHQSSSGVLFKLLLPRDGDCSFELSLSTGRQCKLTSLSQAARHFAQHGRRGIVSRFGSTEYNGRDAERICLRGERFSGDEITAAAAEVVEAVAPQASLWTRHEFRVVSGIFCTAECERLRNLLKIRNSWLARYHSVQGDESSN